MRGQQVPGKRELIQDSCQLAQKKAVKEVGRMVYLVSGILHIRSRNAILGRRTQCLALARFRIARRFLM
jgi:hypothetical protein